MLWAILNQSWKQHPRKQQLYGYLLPISKTITIRQTRHVGHYWRSQDEFISYILLWTSSHGHVGVRQPARTYLQQLCMDTRCSLEDLLEAMNDRDKWHKRVREICTSDTTWGWRWWWYIYIYIYIHENVQKMKKHKIFKGWFYSLNYYFSITNYITQIWNRMLPYRNKMFKTFSSFSLLLIIHAPWWRSKNRNV